MKKLFFFAFVIVAANTFAQELKPTATQALLKVQVIDNKNKPLANQQVTFTSLKDKKEFSGKTDAQGKFSILIPPAQKYSVKYKIFTTVESDLVLDMPDAGGPYTFEYTITASPPRTFTLDNVFFDSGKATLRPESGKELNELAEYMTLQKTLVIEIAGHTDNVGTAEANLKLSEDRASAVKQYLEKKGIAPARVTAKGYGDTKPTADNSTAAGKQKNRRTEVHIISE
ncbi:MAG TPA: OmpA family protein [Chitinophagales bacterium]|nr:OmpA family protein [Chitinophagales bacterium]